MKDITKNKHKGNAESNTAFAAIENELTTRQNDVLTAFQDMPYATSKEVAFWLNKPLNVISGRITELKRMGRIKQLGRRDGCAVYQITQ